MNCFVQTAQDFFRGNMSEVQRQQMFVIVLAVTLLAFLPPDNVQLFIAVFGAFMYIVLRPVQTSIKNKRADSSCLLAPNRRDQRAASASPYHRDNRAAFPAHQRSMSYPKQRLGRPQIGAHVTYKPEVKRVSRHPVTTFTFESNAFDDQVEELLAQIEPDERSVENVDNIVEAVRRYVRQILPDAKVSGFCHARVTRATAFGVAVPEVDVVVTSCRQELSDLSQERIPTNMDSSAMYMNVRGLQKSATRAIADRLVSAGGFKFRRSGFKCDEPKVTIMAPPFGAGDPVPVDLSVNSKVPLYNAAILEVCTAIEPRARSLVMLVKRWAKDRGICHAAKGHLPPYAWTLLAVYFLQVGIEDEPLLPSLQNRNLLGRVHALAAEVGAKETTPAADEPGPYTRAALGMSVGELFTAFIDFYASINWSEEIASVRLGRKAPSRSELSTGPFGKNRPRIEDPFECGRNLADLMNELSIERFHEEIARAKQLRSDGAGLNEMTEPWEPPEPERKTG